MVFRKGKKIIEIIQVKPFKKKGLYVGDGNKTWRVGTFNSNICADEFEKYLKYFLGVEDESRS